MPVHDARLPPGAEARKEPNDISRAARAAGRGLGRQLVRAPRIPPRTPAAVLVDRHGQSLTSAALESSHGRDTLAGRAPADRRGAGGHRPRTRTSRRVRAFLDVLLPAFEELEGRLVTCRPALPAPSEPRTAGRRAPRGRAVASRGRRALPPSDRGDRRRAERLHHRPRRRGLGRGGRRSNARASAGRSGASRSR